MAADDDTLDQEDVSVDSQTGEDTLPTKLPEKSPYDFDDPSLLDDEDELLDEDTEGESDDGDAEADSEEESDDSDTEEETEDEASDSSETTDDQPDEETAKLLESLDLDPEVYDDALVNAMKGVKALVSGLQKKLNEANGTVETFRQREAELQAEKFFNEFDRTVDSLDIPDLGKGTRKSLKEAEMKARAGLLDEMNVIQQGRAASGLKALPLEDLVKKAVGALGLAPQPRKRGTRIARPGQSRRVGSDLSPEKQAERNLAQKMREFAAMEGEETFE